MRGLLAMVCLIFSSFAFAKLNCRVECTKEDGQCTQLGLRSRASALHLNQMLNAANPKTPLQWKASHCARNVTESNGVVMSDGDECIEWMDPLPTTSKPNGTRSWIKGDLSAEVQRGSGDTSLIFQGANLADFSFYSNGEISLGGKVEMVSQVPGVAGPEPRLLIQTVSDCFSID